MLWIDSDMGFDDIIAVMMIAQSDIEVAGISLVFGNAPIEQVRNNAAGATRLLGWAYPVHSGARASILGTLTTAQDVLGVTGIRTRGKQLPVVRHDLAKSAESDAFLGLVDWLETARQACNILALGPLTNIATLALARPDLMERVQHITWMGGSIGRGNHTQVAEFNAVADPEALAIVLSRDVGLRMVELELCRNVLLDSSCLDELEDLKNADGGAGPVLYDLLAGYLDIARARERWAMALYDPLAAAALVIPEAIAFEPVRLDVELSDPETRGQTLVTRTSTFSSAKPVGGKQAGRASVEANAEIGVRCNADRIRHMVRDVLLQAAG